MFRAFIYIDSSRKTWFPLHVRTWSGLPFLKQPNHKLSYREAAKKVNFLVARPLLKLHKKNTPKNVATKLEGGGGKALVAGLL